MAGARSFGATAGPAAGLGPAPRPTAGPSPSRSCCARSVRATRLRRAASPPPPTCSRPRRDLPRLLRRRGGDRRPQDRGRGHGALHGRIDPDARNTAAATSCIVKARLADDTGYITPSGSTSATCAVRSSPARCCRCAARRALGRGGLELDVREHEILADAGDGMHTAGPRARLRRQPGALDPHPARAGRAAPAPRGCDRRSAAGLASRCSAACRCGAMRSAPCTRPRDLDEPRAGAPSGWPTRSCCCCSWRCWRRRAGAMPRRRAGRSGSRVSSQRAYRASAAVRAHRARSAALAEIDARPARTAPMRRLLIGDVGSGKTAVAVHAMLRAVEAGGQAALMAPTETLAQQHAAHRARAGRAARRRRRPRHERRPGRREERAAASASPRAMRTSSSAPTRCSSARSSSPGCCVAVVDEQHRFGVEQRAALVDAHGATPCT